jgi:hypothetical protein
VHIRCIEIETTVGASRVIDAAKIFSLHLAAFVRRSLCCPGVVPPFWGRQFGAAPESGKTADAIMMIEALEVAPKGTRVLISDATVQGFAVRVTRSSLEIQYRYYLHHRYCLLPIGKAGEKPKGGSNADS